MPSTTHYSSYQTTNKNYSDDDDDDDLDALRKAALKTLNSKKRKVCFFCLLKKIYFLCIYRITMIIPQYIEILVQHPEPILHQHLNQVILILLLVDPLHPHLFFHPTMIILHHYTTTLFQYLFLWIQQQLYRDCEFTMITHSIAMFGIVC